MAPGCARRGATEQLPCDSPQHNRHGDHLDQFFVAYSVVLFLFVGYSSFDEEKPNSEKDLQMASTRPITVIRHSYSFDPDRLKRTDMVADTVDMVP